MIDCKDCQFFKAPEEGQALGECRINSPLSIPTNTVEYYKKLGSAITYPGDVRILEAVWPRVKETDWCGQGKARNA